MTLVKYFYQKIKDIGEVSRKHKSLKRETKKKSLKRTKYRLHLLRFVRPFNNFPSFIKKKKKKKGANPSFTHFTLDHSLGGESTYSVMEVPKSNTDHVVLNIEHPDPKLKQSPQKGSNDDPLSQPITRTKTVKRLNFSKPRSRFEEISYPLPPRTIQESEELQYLNPHDDTSSTDDDDGEWYENEEENEEGDEAQGKYRKKRKRKINKRAVIEWTLFLIIMTCLVCSLTQSSLKYEKKWGLEIWKWCLMVMVVFCGRLFSGWVVGFLVFLIERNFMLREKVLYFVYGLRKSFQNCVWLGLVLVAWMIMLPNFHKQNKFLMKVFRALIAVLIAATIWLLKIVFIKVLALSFHVATFFDRMKESVFNHYILETLSGPPLDEEERDLPRRRLQASKTLPARLRDKTYPITRSKKYGSRRIDMERLRKLSSEARPSAWSVKRLVSYVRSSGLSTISRTVDDFGKAESEINSEWEARNCAQRVFKNVAKSDVK